MNKLVIIMASRALTEFTRLVKKGVITLILTALLVATANAQDHKIDPRVAWQKYDELLIATHRARIGFTRRQVVRALGQLHSTKRTTVNGREIDYWTYNIGYCYLTLMLNSERVVWWYTSNPK